MELTEEEIKQMNIAQRISHIRKEIYDKGMDKKGINAQQGYTYFTMSQLKGTVVPLLFKYHLEMIFMFENARKEDAIGNMSQHYVVSGKVHMLNADNPNEGMLVPIMGEAGDSGDKGLAKARTSAVKGFFVDTFMVTDDTDPDDDNVRKSPKEKSDNARGAAEANKLKQSIGSPGSIPVTAPPAGKIIKKVETEEQKEQTAEETIPEAKATSEQSSAVDIAPTTPAVPIKNQEGPAVPCRPRPPAPEPSNVPSGQQKFDQPEQPKVNTISMGRDNPAAEAQKQMCRNIKKSLIESGLLDNTQMAQMLSEYQRMFPDELDTSKDVATRGQCADFANLWRNYVHA